MLIDIYKKDIDLVCVEFLYYDWDKLCYEIMEYGLCNFMLMVLMFFEILL